MNKRKKRFIPILILLATLMFSTVAFASSTGSISKTLNKDNYYTITLKASYLNTTTKSIIQLPEDLTRARD